MISIQLLDPDGMYVDDPNGMYVDDPDGIYVDDPDGTYVDDPVSCPDASHNNSVILLFTVVVVGKIRIYDL